jgi:hypothetical protein
MGAARSSNFFYTYQQVHTTLKHRHFHRRENINARTIAQFTHKFQFSLQLHSVVLPIPINSAYVISHSTLPCSEGCGARVSSQKSYVSVFSVKSLFVAVWKDNSTKAYGEWRYSSTYS